MLWPLLPDIAPSNVNNSRSLPQTFTIDLILARGSLTLAISVKVGKIEAGFLIRCIPQFLKIQNVIEKSSNAINRIDLDFATEL